MKIEREVAEATSLSVMKLSVLPETLWITVLLVHRELEGNRCTVIESNLVNVCGTGCQVGGSAGAQGCGCVLIRSVE
jgi:hypothetical protein